MLRDLVVHYRAVIERPIVPDDQIPELPLVTEREPGLGGEIQQLLDQRRPCACGIPTIALEYVPTKRLRTPVSGCLRTRG
jgi:hypothetical protein